MTTNDKIIEALVKDAIYVFDFDVNDGIVKVDVVGNDGANYSKAMGLTAPFSFDEMVERCFKDAEFFGECTKVSSPLEHICCSDILKAYELGQKCFDVCVRLEKQNIYHKITYILIWDDELEHVHAYVVCKELSSMEKNQLAILGMLQSKISEDQEIIENAGIGIWRIYLKDGELPRMNASAKMRELLGVKNDEMTQEEIYESWHERIKPSAIDSVNASVAEMIDKGVSENTYAWIHPDKGEIFVRCGGTSSKLVDGTIVLRGYHMEVSEYISAETRQKQLLADALDEIKEQENDLKNRMKIISSMANIYHCSYYLDIEAGTFIELDSRIPELKTIIGESGISEKCFEVAAKYAVTEEFSEHFAKFTDLTTINERLRNKAYISTQFIGKHSGWCEGSFIAGDRDENGNCKHVIWCIKDISAMKDKEEALVYSANVDQLTGLYNRRMYEHDIRKYGPIPEEEDFAYVSIDVNGLKNVNDTMGHEAGDELLAGSSECMKQCIMPYGRVYRIGGDEFCAMIFASPERIERIKSDFDENLSNWIGSKIDGISVAVGVASKHEFPDMPVEEMARIADKRMYESKQEFYSKKGIDRKGQRNAYNALCALYTKILKVNLTTAMYSIITMRDLEKNAEMGFSDNIFTWLEQFGKTGQVHPADLDNYLSKTNKEYLTNYFASEKTEMSICYRRMLDGGFTQVVMELVPAEDYSDDNQLVYLYVKDV